MTQIFKQTPIAGMEDSILYFTENYVAKPIMLNKTTITGLTANADGKFIIPRGTFLTGTAGSLKERPNQVAKQAVFTGVAGTLNLLTYVHIVDKQESNRVLTFKVTKPAKTTTTATVAVSGLTIEIKVANDGTNILTTLGDIVTLINGNMEANSLCVASLTDETKADTVATEVASAVTAGGANDTGTGDVDGILMHSVDVTDGEATGALVLAGFVDLDKIDIEPSTNFKTKLPMIAFLRKD